MREAPVAGCLRRQLELLKFMNCLKTSEIKKWLTGQGMRHQPMDCGVPIAGEYELPNEASSRLKLANDLADLLTKDGTKMVELVPTAPLHEQDLMRLEKFRTESGEERPLSDAPGHLFKSRDRDAFRKMLTMALGFHRGWDLYIYSAPSGNSLLIGDHIDIWATKRGLRNSLDRLLTPIPQAA